MTLRDQLKQYSEGFDEEYTQQVMRLTRRSYKQEVGNKYGGATTNPRITFLALNPG